MAKQDAKKILKDMLGSFKQIVKKIDIKKTKGLILGYAKKVNLKEMRTQLDTLKTRLKDQQFKKKFFFTLTVGIVAAIIIVRMMGNIQKTLFKKSPAALKKAAMLEIEEGAPPVKVFKIKRTDFKDTLPCIGNVKGFKEVDLKFQVVGVLESFNFEEGERIQEGDIIASLIQRDALLKLKYSEIELKKNQKLFELGAISDMKMEQSKLEYESAKSDLDKTNIYAMSNGLLGSRVLDVGNYVTPSDKVGVFVDIEKVYAEFNIIERDVPKVALGQRAEVFADAFPNASFSGVIDRIAPIIEGRSRTENIKVEIDNDDGLLKPGMFVRALVSTYEKKDAIVIPSSGLKKKENEYFVYLVTKEEAPVEGEVEKVKDKKAPGLWPFGKKKETPKPTAAEKPPELGIAEIRSIKLGYMTQDLVEVEEGLKEDDLIIIEIQEELKDKTKVEIAEVQEGLI